jgi:hypothetical protein
MKWYRLLAAGVVPGLAVTACGSVTQIGVPAPGTARSTAASGARASASASAAASSLPMAPQPSASSPASVASSTVWFDCTHHGQVEPSDYILTCADAGSVLEHLTWKSWTAQQAVATGVHELNNCTPNCAEGKFIGYPVVVTLWRSEPASGQPGEQYFTRITVRYTGPRPPAYTSNGQLVRHPAEWTEPLGPFGT